MLVHFLNFTLFLCRKVPSLLEYFSYLFHYSTILAGPVCTFREFNDFIDGSDIRPKVMYQIFEWHHIEMIASIWRENMFGHYLFRETKSFASAKLEDKCKLRGAYFLLSNESYYVCYPSSIFFNLKIGEYHPDIPHIYVGHNQPRYAFRLIASARKYLMR